MTVVAAVMVITGMMTGTMTGMIIMAAAAAAWTTMTGMSGIVGMTGGRMPLFVTVTGMRTIRVRPAAPVRKIHTAIRAATIIRVRTTIRIMRGRVSGMPPVMRMKSARTVTVC